MRRNREELALAEFKKATMVEFVDFDQTFLEDHVFRHLMSTSFAELKETEKYEQCISWIGGKKRLDYLKEHFRKVKAGGGIIVVISYGDSRRIRDFLNRLDSQIKEGEDKISDQVSIVYGQDRGRSSLPIDKE